MNKFELTRIAREVVDEIKQGFYENHRGEEIEFEDVEKMIKGTKFYKETSKIPESDLPHFEKPSIYVQNIDTFLKAIELGPDSACLNMASPKHPGGGVLLGAQAQEESLCRRSNLLASISLYSSMGAALFRIRLSSEIGTYPLPVFGGIYSPYVNIYRSPKLQKYNEPFFTNVITVAALSNPELQDDGTYDQASLHKTKEKIKTILRIAIQNGHSKLVLGAFGCGAFHNPPQEMARCFKEVLDLPEFKYSFKEICFAILEDQNSPEGGNFGPFSKVFGCR